MLFWSAIYCNMCHCPLRTSWRHFQQIFKALHSAYRRSLANPFLKLYNPMDADPATLLTLNGAERFKAFKQRVDEIGKAVSGVLEGNKA
jgi:hypothetical protein